MRQCVAAASVSAAGSGSGSHTGPHAGENASPRLAPHPFGLVFQRGIVGFFQEEEKRHVASTLSCLLGDAAPPLGPLRAPLADHMEALERLRRGLQNEWKLLQTMGE